MPVRKWNCAFLPVSATRRPGEVPRLHDIERGQVIALVHRWFFSLCEQTHNTLLVREARD